jgi:hypothetical protein
LNKNINPLFVLSILVFCLIVSCNSKKQPDTSNINVELKVIRFEKDFFEADTNNTNVSMEILRENHHNFTNDFLWRILGLEGVDTALWSGAIKQFYHDYMPIYEETKKNNNDIESAIADTKEALKLVKYYFPTYRLPSQFITFIGPMDAFATNQTGGSGDIITTDALAAGLQLHLGSNAEIYNTEQGMQLYPNYLSRRFTPLYIPVNAMKNIIDDMIPAVKTGSSLLDILIDHGKRMYVLDLLLPQMSDTLKLGYTTSQLSAIEKNEGLIWNYFLENNLLYETDMFKTRSFTNDAPFTAEFGEGSPGFISLFIGREIIRTYMDKNPDIEIKTLLNMDGKKILAASKYKPK